MIFSSRLCVFVVMLVLFLRSTLCAVPLNATIYTLSLDAVDEDFFDWTKQLRGNFKIAGSSRGTILLVLRVLRVTQYLPPDHLAYRRPWLQLDLGVTSVKWSLFGD